MPISMKAVYETSPNNYCVVRWTGRSGFNVGIETWCGASHKAGSDGVLQLPANVPTCKACEDAIRVVFERYAPPAKESSSGS